MAKNDKNSAQLTEEDLHIIDQIFIACIARYYHWMEVYKTPKEYVEYLIRKFKSRNSIAAGRIAVNSLYSKYVGILTPKHINMDLAKEVGFHDSGNNVMEDTNIHNRFLEPPQLKRVFNSLVNGGFLHNIKGKDRIMSELGIRRLPGRPNSTEDISSVEGRPSAYKITELFDKIRTLMTKPEAQELLKKRMLSTSLTYKFERFNLEACFMCARIDPSVLENLISMVAPHDRSPNLPELHSFIQCLASLDDDQLKSLVNQYSKSIAENRPYDMNFLFGLAKLE